MEEADSLWSRNVLLTPGPPLTAYANGLWANRVGCDLRPEIDALETGPIGSTLAHTSLFTHFARPLHHVASHRRWRAGMGLTKGFSPP